MSATAWGANVQARATWYDRGPLSVPHRSTRRGKTNGLGAIPDGGIRGAERRPRNRFVSRSMIPVRYVFDGKDFTTMRGRQPRPQFACTTDGTEKLGVYHSGFVQTFGLVHKNVTPQRLGDENYFNRNAFLHGQMRRSYSPEDSAKERDGNNFPVFFPRSCSQPLQRQQEVGKLFPSRS
jgi:hypothetical protein